MPNRRLEDKIRELCAKALSAEDAEGEAALRELRTAIHEYFERLRRMVSDSNPNRRKVG